MNLVLAPLDGRITLRGLLGSGGMGEVHRGWDAALERPVAVKFVKGGDPREAERLLLEARLQARIEHPHVVRVHDTGTLEGRPCIVLQLVEGRTYAELALTADWRRQVALAIQAARGLAAAHRLGLVHRDVKPANILVEDSEEGPQARLSDFGLARDEEGGLTRSGLLVGTVDFMAPEQVTGTAPVGYRADLYGLGATLYAVLAGRPPFRASQGLTADAQSTRDLRQPTPEAEVHLGDLLRRVMEEDPVPLGRELPRLPADLGVVVAKAMDKDPAQRYATADAFADDLQRVLQGEPILARPAGKVDRVLRWSRRNPLAARSLGAALVVLVVASTGAGWTLLRARDRSRIAAEMSAEATRLGDLLRTGKLMPFHSLAPERQRVRAATEAVRARMAAQGRLAEGPGQYVLGLADRATGRWEGAERHLRAAWDLGFRSEGLRVELAEVYLRRFMAERKRLETLPEGGRKARRLADLEQRYRGPAQAILGELPPGSGEAALLRARAELSDRRHDAAFASAEAALREDGTRYEAIHLKGLVALDRGDRAMKVGKPDAALSAFAEAGRWFQEALAFGRSDPELWRDEGLRSMVVGQAHTWLAQDPTGAFDAAEAAFRRSVELDAEDGETWRQWARLDLQRAHHAYQSGTGAEAHLAHAKEALARAEAVRPESGAVQATWANAHELEGVVLRQSGADGLPSMLEGVRRLRRAVALEPEQESHREGLANTLGTTLDFLVSQPEQGRELAREMVQAARWMAEAFPERPQSELALVVALMNTLTFGVDPAAPRAPLYEEARQRFQRAADMDATSLLVQSDLALAAGAAAETAASQGDAVDPWAGWSRDHARALLKARPADPMGLYALVRGWRLQAEAADLDPAAWAQALAEAGGAADLAVARKTLPNEVTFEFARLIALGAVRHPDRVPKGRALTWIRAARKVAPGDAVLAERERALGG